MNQQLAEDSYGAALVLVRHIDRLIKWRTFYTKLGRPLNSLNEVVDAIASGEFDEQSLAPYSRRPVPAGEGVN